MSLSLTKGEGVTVFTVTSDPRSEIPLVIQLLASMCCSPVCFVSQSLRRLLAGTQTLLGTVQIMVGLFNISLGVILLNAHDSFLRWNASPYWLGGLFIAAGIMSILSERCASPCLVFLTTFMNLASACLAVTAIVLYSVNLANVLHLRSMCKTFETATSRPERYGRYNRYDDYGNYQRATVSPEEIIVKQQSRRTNFDICQSYRDNVLVMAEGIDILLILFAVLQLCVTLTATVLGVKALCKNRREAKPEPDPELYKPLVEEVATNLTV